MILEQQRLLGPGPGPLAKLLVHPLADPRPVAEVDIRHDRVDAQARRNHGGEGQGKVRKAGFTVGLSATAGTEKKKTLTALTLSHGARVLVFLPLQLGEDASQTFRIRRSNISTGRRLPEPSSRSRHWGRMPEAKK